MKWENNINHDLREVDYTGDDWKTLAQDSDDWRAYVRTAMNLRFDSACELVSYWERNII